MGIFKAPKVGSQNSELIVGRLTGVMDLKIFYKGKNRGKNPKVETVRCYQGGTCVIYVSTLKVVKLEKCFKMPHERLFVNNLVCVGGGRGDEMVCLFKCSFTL